MSSERGLLSPASPTENPRHAGILVLVLLIFLFLFNRSEPVYRQFKKHHASIFSRKLIHEVVEDGYYKFEGDPFVIRWWANDFIIMPPKYLKDIRRAGWRHLSFFESLSNSFRLDTSVGDLYTTTSSQRMVDVIKKGLNPKIPQLTSRLVEEIDYAFDKTLPDCADWQEVNAKKLFTSIVHRIAVCFMIAKELSHDDVFLEQSTSLLESIVMTGLIITKLPLGPFRSWLAGILSYPHRRKLRRTMDLLRPLVAKRVEQYRQGRHGGHHDAIQWTLDVFPETAEHVDHDRFMKELIQNLWTASAAPGSLMTEIVFQLLLHPKDLESIRAEGSKSLEQHGWSEEMFNALVLQDSFIRETNRLFPVGSITCVRTVLEKPFTFSDGLTFPVGSRFGFATKTIQREGDGLPNPHIFDGFRFARQHAEQIPASGASTKMGQSPTNVSNLPWGCGSHMCPGRFFAIKMMKVIITQLVLQYDIKWDMLVNERPPCVAVEGQFVPNMQQTVLIKRREGI